MIIVHNNITRTRFLLLFWHNSYSSFLDYDSEWYMHWFSIFNLTDFWFETSILELQCDFVTHLNDCYQKNNLPLKIHARQILQFDWFVGIS